MKPYLLSLVAGLLAGVVYAVLHVRSPAPPIIALLGLLGILIGEQVPSFIQHIVRGEVAASAWLGRQVKPHLFGHLPQGQLPPHAAPSTEEGAP